MNKMQRINSVDRCYQTLMCTQTTWDWLKIHTLVLLSWSVVGLRFCTHKLSDDANAAIIDRT